MAVERVLLGGQMVAMDTATGEVLVKTDAEIGVETAQEPVEIVKALAASPVPVALVASQTWATGLRLQAKRAAGVNTTQIVLGGSNVVSGAHERYTLAAGATFERKAPAGTKFDLANIWIDGETGTDGVAGEYDPA